MMGREDYTRTCISKKEKTRMLNASQQKLMVIPSLQLSCVATYPVIVLLSLFEQLNGLQTQQDSCITAYIACIIPCKLSEK